MVRKGTSLNVYMLVNQLHAFIIEGTAKTMKTNGNNFFYIF